MLKLTIPATELYDDEKEVFVTLPALDLRLEHSLVSLSKWESIWEIPFLDNKERTTEQMYSYVRCMELDGSDFNPELFPPSAWNAINEYINAKKTATWITETKKATPSREVITSELIYYWMCASQIDWQAQDWHLNRLLTLIRVCSAKNQPEKKMSRKDAAAQRQALNAQRRAKAGTRG